MKSAYPYIVLSVVFLSLCSFTKKDNKANYQTIPLPQEVNLISGEKSFQLDASTLIVIPTGNEKMEQNAQFLVDYLKLSTGLKLSISTNSLTKNAIVLELGLIDDNKEAYEINISNNIIKISGASDAGVFYGIQTLRKATPITNKKKITYPAVHIYDYPRFQYRGAMLDVGRQFFSADFIRKYIDILALHNINRFHWHLSEDMGWRVEIKKYPKLTEIGSKRKETKLSCNPGFDGKPYGGYYTQEEIKDIVKYAQQRNITIIPEIDMPGHILSALAAYPELGCTGGPYEVTPVWGIFDDVLCVGKESTFEFIENVLTELMDLFPSEYIHIGGDECPKTKWEKCPYCQARIKELGLKSDGKYSAEHYLQSYYTARIEKFLNKHGRKMIGWDEILEGEVAPNATVMSWRGMDGGVQATRKGHNVIMSPYQYAYFDYYQSLDTETEPCAAGFLPIEQVYKFEPIPPGLTQVEQKHILGAQANLWTEHIRTTSHVEYMLMPRIAALCEVQWMNPEKKNYSDFLNRLPQLIKMYDLLGYNYATRVYDVKADIKPNFVEK